MVFTSKDGTANSYNTGTQTSVRIKVRPKWNKLKPLAKSLSIRGKHSLMIPSSFWWCNCSTCLPLVVQLLSCVGLCNPMDCSTPGFPFLYHLPSLLRLMSIELVMPSNHLFLCRPLLLLLSIFSSIRVFSNESALRVRWPKYWRFSFSTSLSNEYSGLLSFRMDWFDLPLHGPFA